MFGGNEVGLQTAWCDAAALRRDAAASAVDGDCEGYFQWPEWSNTSAWLSEVIARLSFDPSIEPRFVEYARARHGKLSEPFLKGFRPLVRAGNAVWMAPLRKRLLVPFLLAEESLALTSDVRRGALAMGRVLAEGSSPFARDFIDLLTWIASRQAQTFEADAYLRHREGEPVSFEPAREAWNVLHGVLSSVPELSILESARTARRVGASSERVEDSF